MVIFPFIFGYILDLIIGDPLFIPHPIRGIGLLIDKTESFLRKEETYLKIKGLFLLIIVSLSSYLAIYLIINVVGLFNIYLEVVIHSLIIFQILATKSLYTETNKVYKALESGDIDLAKKHLSYLVTRDCENMEEEDIVRSTIETISENIVDGITAPMFFIILGGAPLGMLYKAVNTLDSMVGYKNDKYRDFGFFSAKFDDIVNYIPARFTSLLIVLTSLILKKDYNNSWRILLRDKKNHSSPNSGYAEAPVAGALGIMLGGKVSYFGEIHNKPTMGDDLREPSITDIRDTHKIMFITSFLMFVLYILIYSGFNLWM